MVAARRLALDTRRPVATARFDYGRLTASRNAPRSSSLVKLQ